MVCFADFLVVFCSIFLQQLQLRQFPMCAADQAFIVQGARVDVLPSSQPYINSFLEGPKCSTLILKINMEVKSRISNTGWDLPDPDLSLDKKPEYDKNQILIRPKNG